MLTRSYCVTKCLRDHTASNKQVPFIRNLKYDPFLPLYNRPLLNIQFAMPITWTCVRWLSRYGGVYTVLIILIRIRIKKKEQICPKLPCAFVLQCLIQLIAWFALLILSDTVYRLLQLCALIHSNLVSCSFTNLISYWTKVVTSSPWHLNKEKTRSQVLQSVTSFETGTYYFWFV